MEAKTRLTARPKGASHTSTPSTLPALATGIPTDLHLALLLGKTLLASAALLVRQWLLTGHSESLHRAKAIHHHGGDGPLSTEALLGNDASLASLDGDEETMASKLLLPTRIASPWAIAVVIFVIAAVGQAFWLRVWTWIPTLRRSDPQMTVLPRKIAVLGIIMFASTVMWLMALERLDATLVIIFTQFCEIWAGDLARSSKSRSNGSLGVVTALVVSFLLHVLSPPTGITASQTPEHFYDDPDNPLPASLRHTRPVRLGSPSQARADSLRAEMDAKAFSPSALFIGHILLACVAFLCLERERVTRNASTEAGGRRRAQVLACIMIAGPALVLSIVGSLIGLPALPPLYSLTPGISTANNATSGHSAAYLLLSLSLLVLEPIVGATLEKHASVTARVIQGWPLCVGAVVIVGKVGFGLPIKKRDLFVAILVARGMRSILNTSPLYAEERKQISSRQESEEARETTDSKMAHRRTVSEPTLRDILSRLRASLEAADEIVKTIVVNEDSRKIFQFLCLNLAFMFVQLVWGAWTNSLGLVSDAIHMFFDCLAIGMGLLASVMQNWKHDKVFTYGYSRVETLSGFANGVFLLLISTFIVFEGIDRIRHPPEMHNTRQLLIVSSTGLAVNLFGMFAMGGHHHHGHSHGHGHDHSHGHDHGHHHHSHNMLGIYLHVMADTLGSVGVIISTLLIQYFGWTGFDPIASLVIAFLIVGSVIPLVVDAGRILCLDLGPARETEVAAALREIASIEGVASYSSPRFWPKDAETIVGTIRIRLKTQESLEAASGDQSFEERSFVDQSILSSAPSMTSFADASMTTPDVSTDALPHSAPLVNRSMSASSFNTSAESVANGIGNSAIALPLVSPERVACQVEALLKSRIGGLESLLVQCERGLLGEHGLRAGPASSSVLN